MSHNYSSTIAPKKSYKSNRVKEETKIDSHYMNNSNSKDNIFKNNEVSIKKRKIRNSNSYIESFLSRRKQAADHAQSRRCASTNKFEINIGGFIINENKNISHKELNNPAINEANNTKKDTNIYSNNNNNDNNIIYQKGFYNYKNKFLIDKENKDFNTLNIKENKGFNNTNNILENKDKAYLNKYINKSNNIIVNRNNCYNYFSNFLTGHSDINSLKDVNRQLKKDVENKEPILINEEYDIKSNNKDNSSNIMNHNKIYNDTSINNLENNCSELKEPDELMKAQIPDDIQYDLIKYKKYFTINNNTNNLINLKQNANIINKIDKIINYSNNNTETKKFNADDISTIKFQQPSVSNDTESQILLQEKSNINKKENNYNKTNYSYRDKMQINQYKKLKTDDNDIDVPLSAKNNNHNYNNDIINIIHNNDKNIKKNNSIENFNFVLNNNNINNKVNNEKHLIKEEEKEFKNNENQKDNKVNEKKEYIREILKNKEIENKEEKELTKENNNKNIKDRIINNKKNNKDINIGKEEKFIKNEKEQINNDKSYNKEKDINKEIKEKIEKKKTIENLIDSKIIISSDQFTLNKNNKDKTKNNNLIICYNNNFEQLKIERNPKINKNKLICSKENEIILNKINKKINNNSKSNIFQISKNNITFSNHNTKKDNIKKNLDIKLEITNNENLKIINDLSPINYKITNFITNNMNNNNVKNQREKYYVEEDDLNINDTKHNLNEKIVNEINKKEIKENQNDNNNDIKENIKYKLNNFYSEELYAPNNIIDIVNKNKNEEKNNVKSKLNNKQLKDNNNKYIKIINSENNNNIYDINEVNNIKKVNLIKEQRSIESKRDISNNITERKNILKKEISNLLYDNPLPKTTKGNNNETTNKNVKYEMENNKNNNNINTTKYVSNKTSILQNLLQDMRVSKLQNTNKVKNIPIKSYKNKQIENNQTIKDNVSNNKNNFNKTLNRGELKAYNLNNFEFIDKNNNKQNNNIEQYYNSVNKIPDINLIVEKKHVDILFDEKEYKKIKDKNFGITTTKKNKNIKYEMHNGKLWNTNTNNEITEKNIYLNRVKEDILNNNKLNLYNTYALNNTNNNFSGNNNLSNNNYSLRYRKTSSGFFSNLNDIMPVNNMMNMKNTLYNNF